MGMFAVIVPEMPQSQRSLGHGSFVSRGQGRIFCGVQSMFWRIFMDS